MYMWSVYKCTQFLAFAPSDMFNAPLLACMSCVSPHNGLGHTPHFSLVETLLGSPQIGRSADTL